MKLYEGNVTLEPCHEGLYRLLELNCIQPGAIWLKDTEVVSWPELITKFSFLLVGRAMAQAVSRWPLTAEARVRARVNPCGICGGQSGTGQVFSEFFGFPCKYHSTIASYSSITAP
jgi:hypothetical protein